VGERERKAVEGLPTEVDVLEKAFERIHNNPVQSLGSEVGKKDYIVEVLVSLLASSSSSNINRVN
jgi:hypothetical protein